MKQCSKCKVTKELTQFSKRNDRPCGYKAKCKNCVGSELKSWRLDNKDKHCKSNAKWKKKNPIQVAVMNAARRAAKLKATPNWLTKDHLKLIEMQYGLAHYMTEVTGMEWQVDHIIPLQGKNVSGLHVPWNLRVITASENCSKKERL